MSDDALNYLRGRVDGIYEIVSEIKSEVAVLKYKSGMWGGIAGACVAIGVILLKYLELLP